ncbi:MAG: hypothetical protein J6A54_01945 [Clostridia bacterium]|nr:hypothetical protein [Clostridia bacterium]
MKYTTPNYEVEVVEVSDVITGSVAIQNASGTSVGSFNTNDGNINMTVDVGKAFL